MTVPLRIRHGVEQQDHHCRSTRYERISRLGAAWTVEMAVWSATVTRRFSINISRPTDRWFADPVLYDHETGSTSGRLFLKRLESRRRFPARSFGRAV
ncbi:hypothetical protein [Micromonospora sp. NPDC049679]|uniref:hypothetical protein n=1 Tax=Micromonospora sp. NPDC049679 TaxID=3155920 RepID=UPI0033F8B168